MYFRTPDAFKPSSGEKESNLKAGRGRFSYFNATILLRLSLKKSNSSLDPPAYPVSPPKSKGSMFCLRSLLLRHRLSGTSRLPHPHGTLKFAAHDALLAYSAPPSKHSTLTHLVPLATSGSLAPPVQEHVFGVKPQAQCPLSQEEHWLWVTVRTKSTRWPNREGEAGSGGGWDNQEEVREGQDEE
ncbi:hypothetical protein BKA70DRAFT_1438685 [Coprinopsis sp. MPI-PUGE-AT-0042]|nr:hypothetical protein BKA70DRAFT_1438685 [Coprinopsis sp. MPI-PUGE-AT-0042]